MMPLRGVSELVVEETDAGVMALGGQSTYPSRLNLGPFLGTAAERDPVFLPPSRQKLARPDAGSAADARSHPALVQREVVDRRDVPLRASGTLPGLQCCQVMSQNDPLPRGYLATPGSRFVP